MKNTQITKLEYSAMKEMVHELHLPQKDEELIVQCVWLSSTVWLGSVDNVPACIWGVVPPSLLSNQAYLWLHTTELVKEHQFIFVRKSQIVIKDLLKEFDLIVGHCLAGATDSIRWLRWLGAEFSPAEAGKIPFVLRKK